jgi:hypothetical protein
MFEVGLPTLRLKYFAREYDSAHQQGLDIREVDMKANGLADSIGGKGKLRSAIIAHGILPKKLADLHLNSAKHYSNCYPIKNPV